MSAYLVNFNLLPGNSHRGSISTESSFEDARDLGNAGEIAFVYPS